MGTVATKSGRFARRATWLTAAAAAVPLLATNPVRADKYWISTAATGSWSDAADWASSATNGSAGIGNAGVPTSSDNVYLQNDGLAYTVALNVNTASLLSLSISGSLGGSDTLAEGAFNLSTSGNQTIGTASGGRGSLTLTTGTDVCAGLLSIGDAAGSYGTVSLNGNGSITTNNANIQVGTNGSGTLNIAGGGTVYDGYGAIGTYGNGTGNVNVTGIGSSYNNDYELTVGYQAAGSLTIADGGAASDTNGIIGGFGSSAAGTVTISDPGSTWTNSLSVYVGGNTIGEVGNGTLIVNGGMVSIANTLDVYSTGTVSVPGGTITANALNLAGTLLQNGAGTVALGNLSVGSASTDVGNYAMSAGTLSTGGQAYIGYSGMGTFSQSGGTVTIGTGGSNQNLYLGYNSGANGTLSLSSTASLAVNGSAYIGGTASASGGDGTLTIGGGSMSVANTLKVWSTGTLGLSGGQLSVGTLDLSGNPSAFQWTGGTLALGSQASDAISVPCGGTLQTASTGVTLANGLSTATGSAINISGPLTINLAAGTFTNLANVNGIGTLAAALIVNQGSAIGQINNSGTLSGIGTINSVLSNSGTIDVATSTVVNATTYNGTALTNTASGSILGSPGSTFTVNGGPYPYNALSNSGTISGIGNLTCNTIANYSTFSVGYLIASTVNNCGGTMSLLNGGGGTEYTQYTLSGGTLLLGGTLTNSSTGSLGSFTLSGGTLSALLGNGSITINNTFFQDNGGTITASAVNLGGYGGEMSFGPQAAAGTFNFPNGAGIGSNSMTPMSVAIPAGVVINVTAGLSVTGQGTLTNNGTLTHTPTMFLSYFQGSLVNNGTYTVNADAANDAYTISGTFTNNEGGVLVLNPSVNFSEASSFTSAGTTKLGGTLTESYTGSPGSFTLSGGTLSTVSGNGSITINNMLFQDNGGTITASAINLGGSYEGGGISFGAQAAAGTFNFPNGATLGPNGGSTPETETIPAGVVLNALGYLQNNTGVSTLANNGTVTLTPSIANNSVVASLTNNGTFTVNSDPTNDPIAIKQTVANNSRALMQLNASVAIGGPDVSSGAFTQNGGSVTIGSTSNNQNLYVGGQTSFYGSGQANINDGTLTVNGQVNIGSYRTGAIIQNGGTVAIGSSAALGNLSIGSVEYSIGSYLLGGGSLNTTGNEYIGTAGTATFTQSGGTNLIIDPSRQGTAGNLLIGSSATNAQTAQASYALSGDASLNVQGSIEVGSVSTFGAFSQSGGVTTIGRALAIAASQNGINNTFSFTGGTIAAPAVSSALTFAIGDGTGAATLNLTGSTGVSSSLPAGASIAANSTLNDQSVLVPLSTTMLSNNGVFNVGFDATANMGAISGAGTSNVNGAGATLSANQISQGGLNLSYATLKLTAAAPSTVTSMSATYADLWGSAADHSTVPSTPASLTISGAISVPTPINLYYGLVLNLAGTGDIEGNNIAGDANASVNILPGAVITHNSTGSMYFQQPLTTIEGELDVNAGSVYIFNGGEHTGTVNVASAATAEITGGFSSTASIDDSGTLAFVNTPGSDTDPAVTETGHTFNGNLIVESGATLGFDQIGTGGATFFSKSSTVTVGSNTTLNSIAGTTAVFNNPQAMNFTTATIGGGVTFRNSGLSFGAYTNNNYSQIETGGTVNIGTLNMSDGILRSGFEDNLPTTLSVGTFSLSGGAVGALVEVNSSMGWTGGTVSDNYGHVIIEPNAKLSISGSGGQITQLGEVDVDGEVYTSANDNVLIGLYSTQSNNSIAKAAGAHALAEADATPATNSFLNVTGVVNVGGTLGIGNPGDIDGGSSGDKGTVNASGNSQLIAGQIANGNTSGGYGMLSIADSATVITSTTDNAGMITQSGGTANLGNVDGMTGTIMTTGGKLGANYIRQGMLGVSSGASVAIAANGTASGTSVLSGFSIDSTSTVDLANNDLILNHASGDASSLSTIKTAIHQAYDGGKWDQPGLTSSMAAANPGYGLGYAEASDLGSTSFDGQSVSSAVLVKYTLYGDLDLSGSVDQNDIARLAPNYGQTVSKGWSQGDVNGDGMVDQNDIAMIAPNYGQTVGSTANPNVRSASVKAAAVHSNAIHINASLYTWDSALAAPTAGTVLLKVDNTVGDSHYGDVILQGNSASLYTIDIQSASGNLNSKRYNSLSNQYDNGTGEVAVIADDHTPSGSDGLFSVFAQSSTHINEAGLGISLDFTGAAESIDLTNSLTTKGTGLFAGLANSSADLAFEWSGQSGELVSGEVEYSSPTPEPGSLAILAVGGLTLLRRTRSRPSF